jgi:hypothetical protein
MQSCTLDLSQDFGERLMKDMIEKDGTVDPASQRYIIANAQRILTFADLKKGRGKANLLALPGNNILTFT